MASKVDEQVDRLMRLLDIGLEALKEGDDDASIMALAEGLKTAKELPQKAADIGSAAHKVAYGVDDAVILALAEARNAAKELPQKAADVICLPDRSESKLNG